MDCCTVNGLDKFFDQKQAKSDVQAYLQDGLDQRAQYILDFLREQRLAGQTLLDIGCGAGALLLELIKVGAQKGIGVDASPAYIAAAQDLATKLDMQDRVEFQVMDFAQSPETITTADIVLMDRVVCCYPKMKQLVIPAAQHAHRFLALTYPRDVWWVRLRIAVENLFYQLLRNGYQAHLHPPAEIKSTVLDSGFEPIFERASGEWHIDIFQRQVVI